MFGETLGNFDLTDLIRGEGDWRNMQDVVRRTFRMCLETQQKQTDKIAYLSSQVMALKEEVSRRPSWEEVERLVESKLLAKQPRVAGGNGMEDIRMEITHIKANLESKVSMRTLENLLSKKVDRSDIAVRSLADMSGASFQRDVKQLKEGFLDLESRTSVLETETQKIATDHDLHQQKRDLLVMRTQVENIYRSIGDFYSKDHIKHLLDQKVGHSELPGLLGDKADGERIYSTLSTIESTLERHEKQLTSLRLGAHDLNVFKNETRSRKPHWSRHRSSSHRSSEDHNRSLNDSRVEDKHGALPSRREFEDYMREGRIETMLSKIYQQMCDLSTSHDELIKQVEGLEKNGSSLRDQLALTANKQAVELLAVVVEEQRLRTDSIIQGSVKIKPIYKDLRRLEGELQQIQDFVQLPSKRTFAQHMETITQQIQEVNDLAHSLHAQVHEQCLPSLQGIKSRVELIETIWQAYEVDRDRLQYLVSVVDFTDTPYSNLRELSRSIVQLYFLLQGDALLNQLKDSDVISQSHGCVNHRLSGLEEESLRLTQQVAACQRALLAVKSVLNMDGKLPEGKKTFNLAASSASPVSSPRAREKTDRLGGKPSSASSSSSSTSFSASSTPAPLAAASTATTSAPMAKKIVDFDTALGQLLSSLDDVQIPVHSFDGEMSMEQTWSISGIDQRLAELQQQKLDLRKKLLSEV